MERDWVFYLTTFSTVATPLIVLGLTALGWKYRQKFDRRIELENKLRDERIDTYNNILEPFMWLLMSDTAWKHGNQNKGKDRIEVAITKMLSFDYRKSAFKLSLVGSDAVVRAYNDLMQHFYNMKDGEQIPIDVSKQIMLLLGGFLLEIRRSMGNDQTDLSKLEMLEWFITDARKMR